MCNQEAPTHMRRSDPLGGCTLEKYCLAQVLVDRRARGVWEQAGKRRKQVAGEAMAFGDGN